jgi:hypothetical protein
VGAGSLAAVLAAVLWGVLALRGASPATFAGLAVGVFTGLVSLVVELAMLERAERTFYAQGVQVTFMSFVMRLVVVAPLTLLFRVSEVDAEAFALSYLATFLVYLCWLTWTMYHAPVQYKGLGDSAVTAEPGCGRSVSQPSRRRRGGSPAGRLPGVGGSW